MKIYCDLDQVLCHFRKKFFEVSGKWPEDTTSQEMWGIITTADKIEPFFENLHLVPDAMLLWDYIKHKDTEILTASGRYPEGIAFAEQKRKWVKNRLGTVKVNTTQRGVEKYQYATKETILIDDMEKNVIKFREAGGIAILHISAVDTIRQLKEMGL